MSKMVTGVVDTVTGHLYKFFVDRNHISPALSKSVELQVCAVMHTLMIYGIRNKMPDWRPLPSPIEDNMPKPTHQATNSTENDMKAM
jgi:hypothetical protein